MGTHTDLQFKVRLPRDIHDWIEAQAKGNCRSKTMEIEYRLRQAMQIAEAGSCRSGSAPGAGPALQA
jgi:hypothetical protein